ncbi:glycosyltransferase [Rhodobacterales bacterium FZCC0188]|nr:glycosyltransferase [Rhodobacterales bacterium FZCC0188]
MKILFIKQGFDPEPGVKGAKFIKKLSAFGILSHVITGFPYRPGGRLYPNYKIRLSQRDFIDGINIERVAVYPSHDRSVWRRSATFLTFFCSSLYRGLFVKRCSAVYAYTSPVTVGLAGLILSRLKRIPLIVDVQDLWPESVQSSGMVKSTIFYKLIRIASNLVYKNADLIICQSQGFKNILEKRGIEVERINVIYNWSSDNEDDFNIEYPKKNLSSSNKKFKIYYTGTIGKSQNLEALFRAFFLVEYSCPEMEIHVFGDGALKPVLSEKYKGHNSIHFHKSVPTNQIGSILLSSDAGFVGLDINGHFSSTIPSKLQTYMKYSVPVIGCLSGDAADLIKSAKCGLASDPDNVRDLADNLIQFYTMSRPALHKLGENGRSFYIKNLCFERGVELHAKAIKRTQRP